jgi:hypothetical protein
MELTSTSSFKDIDIDRMLEHTTLDDFMRGLYSSGKPEPAAKSAPSSSARKSQANVLGALMSGRGLEEITEKQE